MNATEMMAARARIEAELRALQEAEVALAAAETRALKGKMDLADDDVLEAEAWAARAKFWADRAAEEFAVADATVKSFRLIRASLNKPGVEGPAPKTTSVGEKADKRNDGMTRAGTIGIAASKGPDGLINIQVVGRPETLKVVPASEVQKNGWYATAWAFVRGALPEAERGLRGNNLAEKLKKLVA